MIFKIICYLSRIACSFIANLDAVNFFVPFGCYVDNSSYAFPSFEETYSGYMFQAGGSKDVICE